MRRIKSLLIIFFFVSAIIPLHAQQNDSILSGRMLRDSVLEVIDSLKQITSHIEVGTDYVSKVVFWGRDFDEEQFGIEPYLKYKSGSGFYLYSVFNYWSAITNDISRTDLGTGYEKQISKKLYLSAGYERWITHHWDEYTRHVLENNLEAHLGYDFTAFNFEPAVYYMFGNDHIFQTDISINGEYFLFSFSKNGEVTFKPEAVITFADRGFLPIYTDYPEELIDENKLKLVDYELNAPFNIKLQNFEIEPAVHYNIPVKAPAEQVSPFFYFSIHLAYNFYFDNGHIHSLYNMLR